jgi:hypothetical protein
VFDIGYAGLSNAVMPALTAFKYAQFALAPAQYGDERALSLTALFIAQFPLCLLGAVFSGVSYIEGPSWRRVLIYVIVVAFVGVLSGLAKLAYDTELGPIIGWAIAMQLVILIFAGPQPALARARIDAGANDALNLSILTVYAGLLAIAGVLLLQHFAGGFLERHAIAFEWSHLAWLGAVYFALRTWSAVYVFTPAFEARRKGYFQRPWIEWLIRNMGRSSGRGEP